MSPIYLAFLGTMFTFLATALGAATVFFSKKISRTACSGPSWALPRG